MHCFVLSCIVITYKLSIVSKNVFLFPHTVLIDKKADDKMKQYSLETEAYVPGVFGSYGIGLLQQRGSVWSNAMRVKYGLLGITLI